MTAKTHGKELERLKSLQQKALMGGGEKARDRQRSNGKLAPRERLDLLFDKGSFVELNDLAESQCMDFGMDLLTGGPPLPMPRMQRFWEDLWGQSMAGKYAESWMRPSKSKHP